MTTLQGPDRTDFLNLLALAFPGGLPVDLNDVLDLPRLPAPFTHGPALCLTARPRRSASPKPMGALFASFPEWASRHVRVQDDPGLSTLLHHTVICIYALAVTPRRRKHGLASALLTEAENRARDAGCRLATLIHEPELAPFYQRMGYTSARQVIFPLQFDAMGISEPSPYLTAIKPLHPDVQVQHLPSAPGPVVSHLQPGWDLPPGAHFDKGRLIT